jgi:LETM1 and EF-hand domain-containing protein 1
MARYMGIPSFGADTMLRIQLRMRVRAIKSDDRDIMWEGVSNLSLRELQLACQERGMRSAGLTRQGYEKQLTDWLELR